MINLKRINKFLNYLEKQNSEVFAGVKAETVFDEAEEIIRQLTEENNLLKEQVNSAINISSGSEAKWAVRKAKYYNSDITWHICSECGNKPLKDRRTNEESLSKFCPFCGCRMKEDAEDES